jgi:hypothetical protein
MKRLLVVAIAAVSGVLGGGFAMLAAQDASSSPRSPDQPSTSMSVVPSVVESAPPEVAPQVLLAWTPGVLDPALEQVAHRYHDVDAVSVVRGEIADLVATTDGEGRPLQRLDPGWTIPLDAVAIDPGAHARLTSLSDQAVVEELADGEALLSRTSAELRGLSVGGTVELAGGTRLTISGIVDDTTIGAAELAVTTATGTAIGVEDERYMLVTYGGDRTGLEQQLRAALPAETPVRFRAPGETPFLRHGDAVLPPLRLKERFGEFAYQRPSADTREFVQDPTWQAEHLVERQMPLLGPMRCHRHVVDTIEGALAELEASNLGGLVEVAEYAGCWNPRLVRPNGDLSHHAWGVAFDLNFDSNPTCVESGQDPRLVAVLERWGFTWGGRWLCPDPAHFEIRG